MRVIKKMTQYGRRSGRIEKPYGVLGRLVGRPNDVGRGLIKNDVKIRRGRR